MVAKPRSPPLFAAMQEEAAAKGDMAVLPGIWEAYHNITHQTLEILRLAAILPAVTHVAKVGAGYGLHGLAAGVAGLATKQRRAWSTLLCSMSWWLRAQHRLSKCARRNPCP